LYRELGYNSNQTPVAQRVGSAILTLPLFPLMTTFDVERVVDALQLVLHEI
jgi:dTDP-4-amino-4,6-dideoxygalactose transaminase